MSAAAAAAPRSLGRLAAQGLQKTYGARKVVKDVHLAVDAGEVVGLLGPNGAGKSTLIRILAGLTAPDAGDVLVDGNPVVIETPHAANELGMSFIHQELAFVPGMTVLENIMLGLPKKTRFGMVDWRAIAEDVKPIADRVGVKAALGASAKGLSTAENWLINIAILSLIVTSYIANREGAYGLERRLVGILVVTMVITVLYGVLKLRQMQTIYDAHCPLKAAK